MISLHALLGLSLFLFAIGCLGILIRRNILIMFMSIELMLNAANLAFVSVARYSGTNDGQIMSIFVMALAACEAAVGLAIVVVLFRNRTTVDPDAFSLLKG